MNDLTFFNVSGLSSWMMASLFRFVCVMPSELILYPNHAFSVSPKSHLCRLIAKFLLSSLSNVYSISFSCCSNIPLDIIIILSRNAFVDFNPSSVVSIIFWNISAKSVRP